MIISNSINLHLIFQVCTAVALYTRRCKCQWNHFPVAISSPSHINSEIAHHSGSQVENVPDYQLFLFMTRFQNLRHGENESSVLPVDFYGHNILM